VLQPDYPLETARLTIRPYRRDDLDGLYDIQSRPDVARYLYWEPRTLDEVREALQKKIAETTLDAEGQGLPLAVVHRESGTLAGEIVLIWRSREHRTGEIGYVFHPDHGGQGLATEAARAGLGLAFDQLGFHRVIGRLDGRNEASARLLERLGMRREAHFVQNEYVKGRWADEVVYAMLAQEWQAAAKLTDAPKV
jgi:RimJ/RimL family protein N-acetyltransferase